MWEKYGTCFGLDGLTGGGSIVWHLGPCVGHLGVVLCMYMQFGVICLLTAVSQGCKGIMGLFPSRENDGGGQGAGHVDILTTRYTNGLLIVDYEAIYPPYTGVKIWLCFCKPGLDRRSR